METVQERMNTLHDEANLGAGNDEPDPTTAENRPQDLRAGEQERNPD